MLEEKMDNNKHDTINSLIAAYLGGNPSVEEIQKLESWILESDENLAYYRQMKNLWETSAELNVSPEEALDKVMKRIDARPEKLSIWFYLQRVAAVLFIPLMISTLWLGLEKWDKNDGEKPKNIRVVAAFGTFTSLELPDGSKVWLNSGSSLQYPDKFSSKNRTVNLVGEAYFEVHSDLNSPFFVNTPFFVVKATGTHFNVSAYQNWQYPSVTLVDGKVSFQGINAKQKDEKIAVLQPNQFLRYDTLTGEVDIKNEDIYKHIAWKDGKLVFRNDLLSDVAKKISLQYNVDIEITGDQVKQYRYRATFENETLSELLALLKLTSPFDYQEISPKYLSDGSFTKKKIIIFSTNKIKNYEK